MDGITDSMDMSLIHSAKDLPERIADDLDWFWLPNREDPRDCWVERVGAKMRLIGVSSARRAEYARKVYPKAKLLPMRGAVDFRLRQIAEGRFDAALMAMAGLKRLFPGWDGGELRLEGGASLRVCSKPLVNLISQEHSWLL